MEDLGEDVEEDVEGEVDVEVVEIGQVDASLAERTDTERLSVRREAVVVDVEVDEDGVKGVDVEVEGEGVDQEAQLVSSVARRGTSRLNVDREEVPGTEDRLKNFFPTGLQCIILRSGIGSSKEYRSFIGSFCIKLALVLLCCKWEIPTQ